MATTTTTRTLDSGRPTSSRRKKEPRTEIWSNLLRQTREAQARSRTQAVQARDLLLCGGSQEDQKSFTERYLARPPPAQPPSRSQRDQRPQKQRGEVRLSNRFAYGYGHVTLFSSPQSGIGGGGAGLFGGEAEEVAKVEVHTIPEAEAAYEETLRRLLRPKKEERQLDDDDTVERTAGEGVGRRPAVCILMSWKEPWLFLDRLQRWLALLSRSLLPLDAFKDESPLEVIKEHQLNLTVVLQHTDHQELLLRESYTEESFDYISQCLRTCLLPLAAALIYVPSTLPPQQPGGPLSEVQKVLYTSLGLDVSSLQAKSSRPDLTPRHNVVDRMAIIVPSGWDSLGKIRLLSETFSPEAVQEGWTTDLSIPVFISARPPIEEPEAHYTTHSTAEEIEAPTNGGATEIYSTSHQPSPLASSPIPSPPLSPSKAPKSAISDYERTVLNPNAHKVSRPPEIEITSQPEQEFLAEMRAQLQYYEAQDAASRSSGDARPGTMAGALRGVNTANASGTPGEALSELGDVSFNVGGVSYDTHSAEAAIERLKRPSQPQSSDSRSGTPRPGRKEHRDVSSSGAEGTPSGKGGEIPTEKLEEYFASLMKRGGSQAGTPRRD